nr:MAG TPA: hypothetical protein [Caudoviricetes sp.]
MKSRERILFFNCYKIFSNILFNLPISYKRGIYVL